jgi:hypothetical protein
MSRFRPLSLSILLSSLALAACGEEQPDTFGPEARLEPAAASPAAAIAGDTWVRFADLPTPRRGAALAAVPKADGSSRLFAIAGGLRKVKPSGAVYSVPVGTVTEYMPGTNKWVRRADAPYVWQVVPQAAVIGGKIYLPGGLTGHGNGFLATRTMAVYTVATNTWTTVNMPQYMTSQTVWVSGGALYVFGKCADEDTDQFGEIGLTCWQSGSAEKFLLKYSPGTNSWAYLATPWFEARYNPVSGTIGGRAYVTAGGSAALDSYEFATGVSRTGQPLARARQGAAGDAVNGRLYVVGGLMQKPDFTWGQSRAMTEWDSATMRWLNRAQVPEVFGVDIRATRVVIGGQARLAILGGFGHHYHWAP